MEEFNKKEDLIRQLKNESKVLNNPLIEEAFRKVDRADFIFGDYKIEAYEDYKLPMGENASATQPTTVAFMLELLGLKKENKVLEIGSGSGYVLALIAHIVGDRGKVFGVEISPELLLFAETNLKMYPDLKKNIQMLPATDTIGLVEKAPYDRILVSVDLEEVSEEIINQLNDGGILVAPVQGTIKKIQKTNDSYEEIGSYPGFAFDVFL